MHHGQHLCSPLLLFETLEFVVGVLVVAVVVAVQESLVSWTFLTMLLYRSLLLLFFGLLPTTWGLAPLQPRRRHQEYSHAVTTSTMVKKAKSDTTTGSRPQGRPVDSDESGSQRQVPGAAIPLLAITTAWIMFSTTCPLAAHAELTPQDLEAINAIVVTQQVDLVNKTHFVSLFVFFALFALFQVTATGFLMLKAIYKDHDLGMTDFWFLLSFFLIWVDLLP